MNKDERGNKILGKDVGKRHRRGGVKCRKNAENRHKRDEKGNEKFRRNAKNRHKRDEKENEKCKKERGEKT